VPRSTPRRRTPCFQYPMPLGQQNAPTQKILFLNPVCPSFCNHVPTQFSLLYSPTEGQLFPSDANRQGEICCRWHILQDLGTFVPSRHSGEPGLTWRLWGKCKGGVGQTHRHQTVGQASLLVAALTPRSNRCSIERLGIGAGALGHLVQRSHAVRPVSCAQTEHSLAVKCVFFA